MKLTTVLQKARKLTKTTGYINIELCFGQYTKGEQIFTTCRIWVGDLDESFDGENFAHCLKQLKIYMESKISSYKKEADRDEKDN